MKPWNAVAIFALGVLTGATLQRAPSLGVARGAAPAVASANAVTPHFASIDQRLARVEDHIAIERLLMEYGRTLDGRDFAAFSRLFATNGEWSGNIGTFKGPAAIEAAMNKAFKPPASATPAPPFYHLLTNAIIDIDGDSATAISKWTFVRFVRGRPQIGAVGYYHDRLVREEGRWRFLRRDAPAMRPAGAN